MKNSSNSRPIEHDSAYQRHFLLSEQDIEEIYWIVELLASTIREKLSEKEISEE